MSLCLPLRRTYINKPLFASHLKLKFSSVRAPKKFKQIREDRESDELDEGNDFTVVKNSQRNTSNNYSNNQRNTPNRYNNEPKQQQKKSWAWNQNAKARIAGEREEIQSQESNRTPVSQTSQDDGNNSSKKYQKVLDFGERSAQKPSYPFAPQVEKKRNPWLKKGPLLDKASSTLIHKIRVLAEVAEVWEFNTNSAESWKRLREVLREVTTLANEVDLKPRAINIPPR